MHTEMQELALRRQLLNRCYLIFKSRFNIRCEQQVLFEYLTSKFKFDDRTIDKCSLLEERFYRAFMIYVLKQFQE